MRPVGTVRILAGVLILVITAVACGSTVQPEQIGVEAPPGDRGMDIRAAEPQGSDMVSGDSRTGDPADGVAAPEGGHSTGVAGLPRVSSPSASPRTDGSETATSDADAPVFAAGTPGVTDDKILVGLNYNDDADAAIATTGAAATTGDQRELHRVMLDYINRTGGVAGREVVPAYYIGDVYTSLDEQSQRACAVWTEDHDVFAVATSLSTDVLRECLHRRGKAALHVYPLGHSDDATYQRFPQWIEPANLSLNALARIYASGLAEQGYFDDTVMRLGLVRSDRPQFERAVESDLKPTLARHGVTIEQEATVRMENFGDLGSASSQISNIVLRFKTSGITHVLFFEPWVSYFLFMQQAETQDYRPRYGLNSIAVPQIIIEAGLVPTAQLRNARLVGWLANFDVPAIDSSWPTLDLCEDIFRQGGITFEDRNARGNGHFVCDLHLQFRQSLQRAPSPVTGAGLIRGAERQGEELELALIRRGRLSPQRHYGVSEFRHASFDDNCPCFSYTSPPIPIP